MMRFWPCLLIVLSCLGPSVQAQDLATSCHATSTYDLTLQAHGLDFARLTPTPANVVVSAGTLRVDGVAVHVGAGERGQLVTFEREVRVLVPRVRAVADHGVDLASAAAHEEIDRLGLGAATREELERRVATHASGLKQRIAASQSTRDWQGPAFEQYVSGLSADLLPLITADLGQQALQAAVSGDPQTALALRDRALDVATGVQARARERLQALRPQIVALCPAIQHLLVLQRDWQDARGKPLQLLEHEP